MEHLSIHDIISFLKKEKWKNKQTFTNWLSTIEAFPELRIRKGVRYCIIKPFFAIPNDFVQYRGDPAQITQHEVYVRLGAGMTHHSRGLLEDWPSHKSGSLFCTSGFVIRFVLVD